MIVVLDTNVIISALLSPKGTPAEIIRRWEADEFEVVTAPPLLAELNRALEYQRVKKHLKQPRKTIDSVIKRMETVATVVAPPPSLEIVADDPADNRVLACAIAGKAAYIVTGDAHLLRLKDYQGVIILRPAGFLTLAKLREEE